MAAKILLNMYPLSQHHQPRTGRLFALLALLSIVLPNAELSAQVPGIITFQGSVSSGGSAFNGNGRFKFALVNSNGTLSFWSNDNSSVAGSEPSSFVTVPVTNSIFLVRLGDTAIPNMTIPIAASVFTNSDVRLRVWFSDGVAGFAQLGPDQRIVSVGYALMSANVPDGLITSGKLANSAVTSAKIADGAITAVKIVSNIVGSAQIADDLELGNANVPGSLNVFRTRAGTPAITLSGTASQISVAGSNGVDRVRLGITSGVGGAQRGALFLYPDRGGVPTVSLHGETSTGAGGTLIMDATNGTKVSLVASGTGGSLALFSRDGQLGLDLDGDNAGAGRVDIRNTNGSSRIILNGHGTNSGGKISAMDGSGTETVELTGTATTNTGGGLILRRDDGVMTARLLAEAVDGGAGTLTLFNRTGAIRASLAADNSDSARMLMNIANGQIGTIIDGNTTVGGRIEVNSTNSAPTIALKGRGTGSAGELNLYNAPGTETIEIIGDEGNASGGQLTMRQGNTITTVVLDAEQTGGGSLLSLYNGAGSETVHIDSDQTDAASMELRKADGSVGILLDADNGVGGSLISVQVLQITGGSDLSENFNIEPFAQAEPQPGMIVCIDPERPGNLILSQRPYDKTVAGVVSGAGGIRPGMLMGQKGTAADGKYPVALTGRVYCLADANHGSIRPGDLITTSPTPGHGMRVSDHKEAPGAIVGKAMSALERGKGHVLVLVSLQ